MGHKLLLADDSITIQKVVGIIFAGDLYDLTVTDNGVTALERAREVIPDIMLVDAIMPGKNGYEVCREARQDPQLATVPLLLLTGVFEPFDEAKAKECGADDFIAKPFESQAIINKVMSLIEMGAWRKTTPASVPEQPEPEPVIDPAAFEIPETLVAAITGAPDIVVSQTVTHPLPADKPLEPELEPFEIVEASLDDDLWGMAATAEVTAEIPYGIVIEEKTGQGVEAVEELEPFVLESPVVAPDYDFSATPDRSGEEFIFDEEPDVMAGTAAAGAALESVPSVSEDIEFCFDEEPVVAGSADEEFSFDREPQAAPLPVEKAEPFGVDALEVQVCQPDVEEILPIIETADEEFGELVPTAVGLILPEPSAQIPVVEPKTLSPSLSAVPTLSEDQLIAALTKVSREVIERIVWEVVPDLAEALIKEEIRKIRESV